MSVYCILEVRYCITSVTVYMEVESVDKNLTDLSYLTAFLSALLVKLRLIEKPQGTWKGTMCTFPISFDVCGHVPERVFV